MASLARCSSCSGFLPSGLPSCPNCGASEPASTLADRLALLLKVAGGASVAMTLMACYGVPVDPYEPPDTDTTGGTGDTETASTGPADSSTSAASAESSTSAAESSSGAESTGGSESGGSDGSSTGNGAVDQPSLPR